MEEIHGAAGHLRLSRPRPASPRPPATPPGPAPDRRRPPTRTDHAQRIGNLGWGLWDLRTGRTHWSDRLYLIFGRDPGRGPAAPRPARRGRRPRRRRRWPCTSSARCWTAARRSTTRSASCAARRPATYGSWASRCWTPPARPWRCAASARTSPAGGAASARSRPPAPSWSAASSPRSVTRRSSCSGRSCRCPRASSTNRGCRPPCATCPRATPRGSAATGTRRRAIDGDGVFLAIGDVSGHGLNAAAAMARLRNGLSGLAFSGAPPDRLLGWLNRLTLHWPTSLTATVFAGRYDPERAHAHLGPGRAPPARPDPRRQGRHARPAGGRPARRGGVPGVRDRDDLARAGDLLLLYTDGLIERRDRDLQEGLDLLVHAASTADSNDPERRPRPRPAGLRRPQPQRRHCVVAIQIE